MSSLLHLESPFLLLFVTFPSNLSSDYSVIRSYICGLSIALVRFNSSFILRSISYGYFHIIWKKDILNLCASIFGKCLLNYVCLENFFVFKYYCPGIRKLRGIYLICFFLCIESLPSLLLSLLLAFNVVDMVVFLVVPFRHIR